MPTFNEEVEITKTTKVLKLEITGSDPLSGTKTTHQVPIEYAQASGVDVADESKILTRIEGATTVRYGRVYIEDAPDGGDKNFTVKIQRSASGGAFADVSNTITINSSDTDRSSELFTWTDSTFDVGDVLKIVVDAGGTTGNQGRGLLVQLLLDQAGVV